jgi:hypothetical protein
MGGMVINDDDHTAGIPDRGRRLFRGCGLEKSPQPRYLLDPQLSVVRLIEVFPVSSDDECMVGTGTGLHLAQMADEIHDIVPMQASRQLAVKQILMEHRQLVMERHSPIIHR